MTKRTPLSWSVRGKFTATDRGGTGKRYQVRAWDTKIKDYRTRSFDVEGEARVWANEIAAKFVLGQDRAGQVTIRANVDEYLQDLNDRPCSFGHVREAKLLLEALMAAGINDLKAANVTTAAKKFMRELKARRAHKTATPRDLAPSTRKKLIIQLKAFGNWLVDHDPQLLPSSPFRSISLPKVDAPLPPVFTLDECRTLTGDKALALKEGLHWALRLWLGLRKEEATWLRWDHFLWDALRVHVTLPDEFDHREAQLLGVDVKDLKRDKERLAVLPEELAEILRPLAREGRSYVFPDAYRARGPQVERKWYLRHLKALEITVGERNPHQLRATNASVYLKSGMDCMILKRHLGHESLSTTEGYARSQEKYPEEVAAWAGKLRFRQAPQAPLACKSGANSATKVEQDQPVTDAPEEELFIILPSTSDIFRPDWLRSANPHPEYCKSDYAGSIPAGASNHNQLSGNELDEESDPPPAT